MTVTTRSRNIDKIELISRTQDFYDPAGVISVPGSSRTLSRLGLETIISSGHRWPPKSTKKFEDIGGEMVLRRRTVTVSPGTQEGWTGTAKKARFSRVVERQPVWPGNVPANSNLPSPIAGPTMLAQGVAGWNKFKPTKPEGGLGQFVGEIRDLPKLPALLLWKYGLKSFLKDFSRRGLKRTSGEFLNYQFGWRPFYNDIRQLSLNVVNTEKKLIQLKRDNGRPVRRQGIISKTTSGSVSTSSAALGGLSAPVHDSQLYDGGELLLKANQSTTTYTFSGRFRYYIPGLDKPTLDEKTKWQLMRIIYGASFDPFLLYQLTPWSWLADWVASIGPSIENITTDPLDNLVADYAYVTAHKVDTEDVVVMGRLKNGPSYFTSYRSTSEVKQRAKASPYGFGFYEADFSPTQIAILAALGFSRSR